MRWVFLFLGLLLVGQATAQTDVQIQSEALAPVSVTQPVPPPPPFTIPGVVATLEQNEGFARDAAMTQAARIALPQAIVQLNPSIEPQKADEAAKSVGDPMAFVKSYKIVKEVLVPKYQLTVDLVFDGVKLKSNFGHLIVVVSQSTVVSSVTTMEQPGTTGDPTLDEAAGGEVIAGSPVPDTTAAPVQQREIYLRATGALAQDKFFSALDKAGLKPSWQVVRRDGGVIAVGGEGTLEDLQAQIQKMGYQGAVVNGMVEVSL